MVLDSETGEEFFGSRLVESMANSFAVGDFLSKSHEDELGGPRPFPGRCTVWTFDLFARNNADRGPDNFVLIRDGLLTNLCPIDFTSNWEHDRWVPA